MVVTVIIMTVRAAFAIVSAIGDSAIHVALPEIIKWMNESVKIPVRSIKRTALK